MYQQPEIKVVCRLRPSEKDKINKKNGKPVIPCVKYNEESIEVLDKLAAMREVNVNAHRLSDDGSRSRVVTFNETPEETLRRNTLHDLRKTFTLDRIFGEPTTQEDLFTYVGMPIVKHVLQGYNGSVLSYGQTGSGKTHSMFGPGGGLTPCFTPTDDNYAERGLLPRMVERLFSELKATNPVEREWSLKVSVFEIYKEDIFDLIANTNYVTARIQSATGARTPRSGEVSPRVTSPRREKYRIREDTVNGKGIYVESLEMVKVDGAEEVMQLVQAAAHRRHTESTGANSTSSRSHILVCCYLQQVDYTVPDGPPEGVRTNSQLNFVDLAGSEKVAKTKAEGERLKEAQQINLSLTLLGNVIHRLTDGSFGYIPYRDSKLTRVLQESLGGNSITTLLCHCNPDMVHREETLSTLRFAQRAKLVKNKPRVNRELTNGELKEQLAVAHQRIEVLEQKIQVIHTKAARTIQEEEVNPLQALVDSLMKEVEELKEDLLEKNVDLSKEKKRADFYQKENDKVQQQLSEREKEIKKEKQALQEAQDDIQKQREDNKRLQDELEQLRKTMAEKIRSPSCISSARRSGTASPLGGLSARKQINSNFSSPRSRRGGSYDPECKLFADPVQGAVANNGACPNCGHMKREMVDASCNTVDDRGAMHVAVVRGSVTQIFADGGEEEDVCTTARGVSQRSETWVDDSRESSGPATVVAGRSSSQRQASPSILKPEEEGGEADGGELPTTVNRRLQVSADTSEAPTMVAPRRTRAGIATMTDDEALKKLAVEMLADGKLVLEKELVQDLYHRQFPAQAEESQPAIAPLTASKRYLLANGSLNSEAILQNHNSSSSQQLVRYTSTGVNATRSTEDKDTMTEQLDQQRLQDMEEAIEFYQQSLNETLLMLLTEDEKKVLRAQLLENPVARREKGNSLLSLSTRNGDGQRHMSIPVSSRHRRLTSATDDVGAGVIKHRRSSLDRPEEEKYVNIDDTTELNGAAKAPANFPVINTANNAVMRHRRSSVEPLTPLAPPPVNPDSASDVSVSVDVSPSRSFKQPVFQSAAAASMTIDSNTNVAPRAGSEEKPTATANGDVSLLEVIRDLDPVEVLDRVLNELVYYKKAEEPALRRSLGKKEEELQSLRHKMAELENLLNGLYSQLVQAASGDDEEEATRRHAAPRSLPSNADNSSREEIDLSNLSSIAPSSSRHNSARLSMPDALREQVKKIQKDLNAQTNNNNSELPSEPSPIPERDNTQVHEAQEKRDATLPYRDGDRETTPEMGLSNASEAFNRFEVQKYDFIRDGPNAANPNAPLVAHTPLRTDEKNAGNTYARTTVDAAENNLFPSQPEKERTSPTKRSAMEVGESNLQIAKNAKGQLILLLLRITQLRNLCSEREEHIRKLEEQLEEMKNKKEDFAQETDALRQMIDTLRRENALMHSALNDMNVDLHAYRSKLMARESENKQLEAEAAKLKIKTSRLLTTAEQQEFCDMGEVELVMKAEDVAAMGDDLRKCATYRDVILIEKKQKLISRDLKRLKRFSNVMLQLLQLRPRFNTANLESRRLNMLQSLADLTGRMEVVNEVLLKSEVS